MMQLLWFSEPSRVDALVVNSTPDLLDPIEFNKLCR